MSALLENRTSIGIVWCYRRVKFRPRAIWTTQLFFCVRLPQTSAVYSNLRNRGEPVRSGLGRQPAADARSADRTCSIAPASRPAHRLDARASAASAVTCQRTKASKQIKSTYHCAVELAQDCHQQGNRRTRGGPTLS